MDSVIESYAGTPRLTIPILAAYISRANLALFVIMVGTSRCDVPARVSEGGTNARNNHFVSVGSAPDGSLCDGNRKTVKPNPATVCRFPLSWGTTEREALDVCWATDSWWAWEATGLG
jgi:hypothetical protein